MRILVLVIAGLMCGAVYADTDGTARVHLGGYSVHLWDTGLNGFHEMTLFEYKNYLGGWFTNSHGRKTVAAAWGWVREDDNWRTAIYIGANYGYTGCYNDDGDSAVVCPMVVPSISYTGWRVQPTVLMKGSAFAFTLSVEF